MGYSIKVTVYEAIHDSTVLLCDIATGYEHSIQEQLLLLGLGHTSVIALCPIECVEAVTMQQNSGITTVGLNHAMMELARSHKLLIQYNQSSNHLIFDD